MKVSILITACMIALSGSVNAQEESSKAQQVLQRFLDMQVTQENRYGEERQERVELLSQLKSMPEESVKVIARAMPGIENPMQRIELAEVLKDIPTKESADILCGLLKDPNDEVRREAIGSLRMLARRTDRTGPARIQRVPDNRSGEEKERAMREALMRGETPQRVQTISPQDERLYDYAEFEPKVEGLVPYLIQAATDSVDNVRIGAMYALADTRDISAQMQLRKMLKDSNDKIRFYAASFLTEYQDASGMYELMKVLARLNKTKFDSPDDEYDFYHQSETLLASFERITGKSFGSIPMNPSLSSSLSGQRQIKEDYAKLLKSWTQWWAWEPETSED